MTDSWASRINGWERFAEMGYKVKRVDNEVWVKYPHYEMVTDLYGQYFRQIIRKYPVCEFRNEPDTSVRDIEAFEQIRRERRPPYFS